MREEIANLVFPVLTYGLRLKERVLSSDPPDLRTAQKELQGLLLADTQAARWPDFGGETPGPAGFGRGGDVAGGAERFLGIRYALVCWLDEIMIRDTPWKTEWTEHKLEQALYQSNDRNWQFWHQADRAAREGRTDALEAFYLCAMLGFRGEYEDRPDDLRAKLKESQDQIDAGGQTREWAGPVGGQPKMFVPPLEGEQRKQRMLLYAVVSLLLLIPVSMFSLVYLFR